MRLKITASHDFFLSASSVHDKKPKPLIYKKGK